MRRPARSAAKKYPARSLRVRVPCKVQSVETNVFRRYRHVALKTAHIDMWACSNRGGLSSRP